MYNKSMNSLIKYISLALLMTLAACGSFPNIPGLGNSKPTDTSNVPVTGGNPTVSVKDQDTDGTSVTVEDVVSPGPGWMVIHNQLNGTIGDPIGETQLNSGETKNVVVSIDQSKATPIMYAMLHVDGGVIGKYEFPGPDVPVMLNNEMVSPPFNANITTASAGTATPDGGMAMTTPSGTSAPSLKVSDQALNADSVMVDDVVSSGPGWVVIYTTDPQGQPDQPIGHAAVNDGDNQNVVVPVDAAKAQGTLVAQLHVDKGTPGTFDFPGADEPVMVGVQMVAGTFKILAGQAAGGSKTPVVLPPSVTVEDQEVKDGTVTVAQIVSNGNWWLVIHKANADGTMGEYIGQTLIKNGINTNVVVKINMKLATPVLYAMLHEDKPPLGILEFPGPDVPIYLNGEMIAPAFNVTGVAQDVTINIHKVSDSVSFLTDGSGNSLYISLNDAPGKSNCDATCQQVWKAVIVNGRVLPGAGVVQTNLGVITLPNGTHQVTYLGAPLYTYSKDVNPGDTSGHGINGVWFLVTP